MSILNLINIRDICLNVDKAMIFLKSISNSPLIPEYNNVIKEIKTVK